MDIGIAGDSQVSAACRALGRGLGLGGDNRTIEAAGGKFLNVSLHPVPLSETGPSLPWAPGALWLQAAFLGRPPSLMFLCPPIPTTSPTRMEKFHPHFADEKTETPQGWTKPRDLPAFTQLGSLVAGS